MYELRNMVEADLAHAHAGHLFLTVIRVTSGGLMGVHSLICVSLTSQQMP